MEDDKGLRAHSADEVKAVYETINEMRNEATELVYPPKNLENPQVWMDVSLEGELLGRITIECHMDRAPIASENFRALCTGEKGEGLTYKGSKFTDAFRGGYINGGDIRTNPNEPKKSIYGGTFKGEMDREIPLGHGSVHLLATDLLDVQTTLGKRSMVNSAFSIMFMDLPHVFSGNAVCVGQVLAGMEIVDIVQIQKKTEYKYIIPSVMITDCGQLSTEDKIDREKANVL